MKTTLLSVGWLSLVLAVGCGGSAMPVAKVADSKATIRAAEEAGASNNPQATLHLKLARDQLNQAEALINENENDRAALFLNQSQADAEVALGLAHEDKERSATQASLARLQQLQSSNPNNVNSATSPDPTRPDTVR
ncbi:MAG TPA: DUF4398 domain-containing protein [Polyangiaceae bacterium]|jgi:hypothetical protein|nr:DUF4398 domain-containing protein [Polyangiaceae bacterium]